MADSNKEIVLLDDFEHVRLKPTMWVGSIEPSEEDVPIVHDGRIRVEKMTISIGFYKMFHEILDNAIDEAKRLKGKMTSVTVSVDSKTGEVTVSDSGEGFYKGTVKNKKSGVTNIETAVSMLKAGSNFKSDDTAESLIGTNGVGAALVNMLSSKFFIDTQNKEAHFRMEWDEFKSSGPVITKGLKRQTGTTVGFVPSKKVFKRSVVWDRSIIHTQMIFKRYLIKKDKEISGLDLRVTFDGEPLDLDVPFYPKESFVADCKVGTCVVYESFEGSGSVSFVNSAMCTGLHQRIVNEFINAELVDSLGHHFYQTFIMLNLPPKLVRFRDQNKTRLDSTRDEIQGTMQANMLSKLEAMFSTPMFARIRQKVEDRKMASEMSKLRSAKKKLDVRRSNKYFPPSGRKENLFIVEGESAKGSILQKRDVVTDAVYTLKGKIKNVRSVSDLSGNQEVVELMQILDLDLDPSKRSFTYKRVIVATDADTDGGHIFSLLVNLFAKWFPYLVDEGRLFLLRVPLVTAESGKKRLYYYDMPEFEAAARGAKGVRYLKGLGALDLDDWEHVMGNKKLVQVKRGDDATRYLEMAFGTDASSRRSWLKGEF